MADNRLGRGKGPENSSNWRAELAEVDREIHRLTGPTRYHPVAAAITQPLGELVRTLGEVFRREEQSRQEQIDELQVTLKRARELLRTLDGSGDELLSARAEADRTRAELDEKLEQHARLRTEYEELLQELDRERLAAQPLQDAAACLEQDKAALQARIKYLEADIEKNTYDILQVSEEAAELRRARDTAELQTNALIRRIDDLALELTDAQNARWEAERAAREAAERQVRFERLWDQMSLPQRLAFVRSLLNADHPYSAALQRAGSLLDLLDVEKLREWLADNAAGFAASAEELYVPEQSGDAESMAGEFLAGVRSSLEKLLGELGIEAIRPATGSPLTPEHQPPDGAWSPEWSRGIVDQCLRRGYRRGDEILVPAVVLARTAGAPPVLSASGANGAGSQRDGYHSGLAGEAPPWLRTLEETARNLSDEEAGQVDPILRMFQELSREVAAANDAEGPSDEVLRPLLAELSLYLGAPRKRPKLPQPWSGALDTARGQCLTWLDQATQVIQVAPKPDEPVEPDSMEVVGEVPCVSAELAGCISEVVAIGFQRRGRAPAIYPAKVRRYRDTRSGS